MATHTQKTIPSLQQPLPPRTPVPGASAPELLKAPKFWGLAQTLGVPPAETRSRLPLWGALAQPAYPFERLIDVSANSWLCEDCGSLATGDLCIRCGRAMPVRTGTRSDSGNPATRVYPQIGYANGWRNAERHALTAAGLGLVMFGLSQLLSGTSHFLVAIALILIGLLISTRRWTLTALGRVLVKRRFGR